MVSGGLKGVLTCSTRRSQITGRIVNYTPNRKIIRIEPPMAGPNIKGVHCISCKISTTPATQPIWNLHMLNLSIFSSAHLFKTSHNFLLFLHKITFFSFVELVYAFCYSLPIWNCNSCCSQINPFLLVKITYF